GAVSLCALRNRSKVIDAGRLSMSLKNCDVHAAAPRFPSRLKAVARSRALVLLSVLAALSVAGAAGGLVPPTEGYSPAPTAVAASADFVPTSQRSTHGRWLAARAVCEQVLERGGPDALPAYSICVRRTLADDPML